MSEIHIGTGFVTLLTCIFVIAKIWGKIDWSWWWVFSPVWITAILMLVVLIIVVTILIIVMVFK
jgi:hypothetical protein